MNSTEEERQFHRPMNGMAVVILHYNRIDLTRTCVESLQGQSETLYRILVVDNASNTHSESELRTALPRGTEVMRLPMPAGFSGGMNVGIREFLKDNRIQSILLLNNDTRAPAGFVDRLEACLSENPEVGMVGCELEGVGGGDAQTATYRLKTPFKLPMPVPTTESFDYLLGACLLVRRAVFETVGLLDESFFFFGEDADFSIRVRAANWKQKVVSDVKLHHFGSATIGQASEKQAAWYRAGSRQLLTKHFSYEVLRSWPPFLFRLMMDILRRRWPAVRGNLYGFFHRNLAADIRIRKQPFEGRTLAVNTMGWKPDSAFESFLQTVSDTRVLLLTTRENHDVLLGKFSRSSKVFFLPTGIRESSWIARVWGRRFVIPWLARRYVVDAFWKGSET